MKTKEDVLGFLNAMEIELPHYENHFKFRPILTGFNHIKQFLIEEYYLNEYQSNVEDLLRSINKILLNIINEENVCETVLEIVEFENKFVSFLYEFNVEKESIP